MGKLQSKIGWNVQEEFCIIIAEMKLTSTKTAMPTIFALSTIVDKLQDGAKKIGGDNSD